MREFHGEKMRGEVGTTTSLEKLCQVHPSRRQGTLYMCTVPGCLPSWLSGQQIELFKQDTKN